MEFLLWSLAIWSLIMILVLSVFGGTFRAGVAWLGAFFGCVFFLSPALCAPGPETLQGLRTNPLIHVPKENECHSSEAIIATMSFYNLEYRGLIPLLVNNAEVVYFSSENAEQKVFVRANNGGGCYLMFMDWKP